MWSVGVLQKCETESFHSPSSKNHSFLNSETIKKKMFLGCSLTHKPQFLKVSESLFTSLWVFSQVLTSFVNEAGLKSPNPTIIWTLQPMQEKSSQTNKQKTYKCMEMKQKKRFPQTAFTDNNIALWLISFFNVFPRQNKENIWFLQKVSSQSRHSMTASQEDNFSHPF